MIKFPNSTYLLSKNHYDQTYQLLPYTIFNITKNESNIQSAIHHIWTYKLFFDIQQRYVNHACSLHFFSFCSDFIDVPLSQLKSLHRSNFTNQITILISRFLTNFHCYNNRKQTRWIFFVLNESTNRPLARYIFFSLLFLSHYLRKIVATIEFHVNRLNGGWLARLPSSSDSSQCLSNNRSGLVLGHNLSSLSDDDEVASGYQRLARHRVRQPSFYIRE